MKSHSLNFIASVSPGSASINGTAKIIDDSPIPHVPVGRTGWFIICSSNHYLFFKSFISFSLSGFTSMRERLAFTLCSTLPSSYLDYNV